MAPFDPSLSPYDAEAKPGGWGGTSWGPAGPSPVAFDLGVGGRHAGEHDPLALLHRLGLDGQGDSRGICGRADGAVMGAGTGSV